MINDNSEILNAVIEKLKEVYDPDMPIVDIYTLGLIYDVSIDTNNNVVYILMTFTTPACPMADVIEAMVKDAVFCVVPKFKLDLQITFDPMWSLDMIKDQDLRRMFE